MTIKYSKDHEWINAADANAAVVGITLHAQDALGDVVFVDLPAVGTTFAQGDVAGVVESVKAASDIYAPVAGEIVAGNDALADSPEQVNADAYGSWMYRIKPDNAADLAKLLDAAAYEKLASE